MKSIDKEIYEVEQRLHTREALIKQTATQTRRRALQSLKSPLAIGGAVVLGFLVAGRIARPKRSAEPAVSPETKEQTKGFALGTLLMTAGTWFVRSQFGGPVGLAQWVLAKVKSRPVAGTPPPAYR
jgi:hypothetical protein